MNTVPTNKIDALLLWLALPFAGIAAFCAFYFAPQALTDFFDYGEALPYIGFSAIGFALLCIAALALKLPSSPYRRVLICAWILFTITGLLSSFPATNPILLGFGFLFNLGALACFVLLILFAISVAKDSRVKRDK